MIAATIEGFVVIAEQRTLRPTDEPVRPSFEATMTRLDRLLGLRELDGRRPGS